MQLGMSQQTLQEMTKLAPRRVYYPRGMTAMEQVNFHSLPGLCAHEGLAFLAHNAHMASGANGCTRLGAGPIGAEPALVHASGKTPPMLCNVNQIAGNEQNIGEE